MKSTFLASLALSAALSVFAATPAQAQTYTYALLGYAYNEFAAPPIQARDGLLYDVGQDQTSDDGIVFNTPLASTANANSVYVFGDGADGGLPVGGVVQGPDGLLYGTTGLGGSHKFGVIYSITGLSPTLRGTESTLYNFAGGNDGISPQGTMIFDSSGNLYGSVPQGAQHGAGMLFKFTPGTSAFTDVYEFGAKSNCADGAAPYAGPLQGSDGNLYGTTAAGGTACAGGGGTLYKMSTAGALAWNYAFCSAGGSCVDGSGPNRYGALVEYSDGNFYGNTSTGGAHGAGTLFKVTPAGVLTTLYSFDPANGTDGSVPVGGLIVGSDGNFYGTTQQGGASNYGTVFKYTPGGTFTTLYAFTYANFDGNPYAGLIQGSDGNFYGLTSGFLDDEGGFVYEISVSPALAAPVQISFGASSVSANSPVSLNWQVLNAFSQTLQNCVASVQGSAAGAGIWTGLQTGSYSATTKLFAGSASITPTAAGTYTYALTCGGQESGFATLNVTASSGKATPSIVMSATPNPATVGQVVSIHVTASGSGPTPTGMIVFKYGTLTIGSVALSAGGATVAPSTAGLPAGAYGLTASYSGDSNYNAAVSALYTVTLNKLTPSLVLSATPNPVPAGQSVTISAMASGSGPTPTGTVAIKYGSLTLASLPLAGGTASFSHSSSGLPANTYELTASYSGDANYAAGTSASYGVTVLAAKASTSVTLTANPSTVSAGGTCTLQATVKRAGGAAGTPGGSVTFSSEGLIIGTVTLNSAGVGTLAASTAGVKFGFYPVIATYSGDAGDAGAVSASVQVYVL